MSKYIFRYPLEYLDKKRIFHLKPNVSADLELDGSGGENLYEKLLEPSNTFSRNAMSEMSVAYTTDTVFLKQTQKVIEEIPIHKSISGKVICSIDDEFCNEYAEIKDGWGSEYFKEKYSFLEWEMLDHLNHSSEFLQILSFINLSSPLLSLLIPIIFLLFPFIIIRMKNIPISFTEYLETLKEISRHHFIGKMLNIKSLSFENIVYIVGIGALYCLQMYQNVQSCIRYYQNTKQVNTHLSVLKKYVSQSRRSISAFVNLHSKKTRYRKFCEKSADVVIVLEKMEKELERVSDFSISFKKINQVGYMLKTYYAIYSIPEYRECLEYSAKFHGYLECLGGIHKNMIDGYLGKTQYYSNASLKLRDMYYLAHFKNMPITNDCVLKKNRIITGVNASGKTTFLKSVAINIILSQQFGFGCFSKCKMTPYECIHSYLNIPDTSGRDSLFQAESRRCKEIIDHIEKNQSMRHFCIFDELYSGTNPEEATKSAVSFLRFLAKRKNVDFILTTHYLDICRTLEKNLRIENYKMMVQVKDDGGIIYTYITQSGISEMKGGIEILKTMDYPEEILAELLYAIDN